MKKVSKIEKEQNFLELRPVICDHIKWVKQEDGVIQIIIPRSGKLEKLVRYFLKTPETMKIDLDLVGSHVWSGIEKGFSIGEIGQMLEEEVELDVDPVYERLATYINILRNNKFIDLYSA